MAWSRRHEIGLGQECRRCRARQDVRHSARLKPLPGAFLGQGQVHELNQRDAFSMVFTGCLVALCRQYHP